jgi:hypothetical protein
MEQRMDVVSCKSRYKSIVVVDIDSPYTTEEAYTCQLMKVIQRVACEWHYCSNKHRSCAPVQW